MPKNNNNNNKIKHLFNSRLTRRLLNATRRSRRNGKVSRSNYEFPILSDPIVWSSPEYTEMNLNIQATELLYNNPQFTKLSDMYQYYKIEAVTLKSIPQPINGSYPPSGWVILQGNEDIGVQYSAIPRLPGAKLINSYKTTTHAFRRVGRQKDFGWYNNTGFPDSHFNLRIHFSSYPGAAQWIFQVKYFVKFSTLIEQPSNKVVEGVDIAKPTKIVPKPIINTDVIKQIQKQAEQQNLETSNLDISAISSRTSKTVKEEEEQKKQIQLNNSKMLDDLEKSIQARLYKEGESQLDTGNKVEKVKFKNPLLNKVLDKLDKKERQFEKKYMQPTTKEEEEPNFEETFQLQKVQNKETAEKIKHLEKTIKQFQNSKKAKKYPGLLFKAQQELEKLKQKLADELMAEEV